MGQGLIKPDRDVDLYIRWTTVTDGPFWMGTRAEAEQAGVEARILDFTDQRGTSGHRPFDIGAWDEETIQVALECCGQRLLPRAHLVDYAEAVLDGRIRDACAMTDALDDE